MFLVEGVAGLTAHSTSLLADALDMLGDALVCGFSLFVLARSARWQAGAALAKGEFMLAFGIGVLGELVKSGWALSNAMRVWVTGSMYAISQSFNHSMQDRFSARS
jgi:divalent metal cation (Fe/Co/Zn/Cd) transporter